jgi:hypothetical protein
MIVKGKFARKDYLFASIVIVPYHSIHFINMQAKKRKLSRYVKNRKQQYANTQILHLYLTKEGKEERMYKIL